MDQRRMRWVENGMDCQAESVVSGAENPTALCLLVVYFRYQ